ncbi:MAG: SDR family oxidoreductase [Bacteroidota bacterium]
MSKNILLIGGSHGIGYALAKKLVERNHTIYIASRTKEQLEGLPITHLPFDVSTQDVASMVLPERLDGFVYLPGSINLKPFKMLSLDTFREDMELNFFGLVKVLKKVLPLMTQGSSTVFYSTVAVGTGMPFHASVAAAKGALEGFTKSLAAEYAPNIRVNCVAPSLVDTPLAQRLLNNDKKREMMSERHPLKRFGNPEDIANLTAFLLADDSSWITGQIIGVDGGLSTLNVS